MIRSEENSYTNGGEDRESLILSENKNGGTPLFPERG